jgi:hypothetical protein
VTTLGAAGRERCRALRLFIAMGFLFVFLSFHFTDSPFGVLLGSLAVLAFLFAVASFWGGSSPASDLSNAAPLAEPLDGCSEPRH